MAERSADAANASTEAHAEFLARLQQAVRSNNRQALLGLVALPLRVDFPAGSKTYNDRRSIDRDFERIFTPRVRQAALGQRAERLFRNSQGAMVGDGQVWFDVTCSNPSCEPPGPVRIKAINP